MNIDERINGRTKLIALVGNPVEHTISPYIHNTLSKYFEKNLIYIPFKVEKNRLDYVVEALRELGVVGFNVTIPYKREIMRFIDENAQEALLMGAVNTVKIVNGKLLGYNTDAEGFKRAFKEESGADFAGKSVLIIGAGGAARAIAVKIANEGVGSIFVLNRTFSRAVELAELVNTNIENIAQAIDLSDTVWPSVFASCDIIINTTAQGMYPKIDEMPLACEEYFRPGQLVYDVIYNPQETKFLRLAGEKGARTMNGFRMLLYQATIAYEIWTGIKIPDQVIQDITQKIGEKVFLKT